MSWTNAVVTEAGLALQAKLVDGQTLGFLRVAAGTGTVDPSVLANQTALANEKQTLTFQPPNVLDGAKIKVPVMLNNIGLETGYMMQQLGFFADDPDNGEILYAIVQDEVGDAVPSQTESPGFVIEWAFVFQFGNASEVTVTLDPVGLVSIGMVGQPGGVAGLGENGAVPIGQGGTGATTAQEALYNIGAEPNENLLDNAYFVGDGSQLGDGVFPINQRRLAVYNARGYTIDRWLMPYDTAQLTLESDGIVLDGTQNSYRTALIQPLLNPSKFVGKTVTISAIAKLISGTGYGLGTRSESATIAQASPTLNNTDYNLVEWTFIPEEGFNGVSLFTGMQSKIKVQAIKFEVGNKQTLGKFNLDGSLELFRVPSYSEILAKCQRYALYVAYCRARVCVLNAGDMRFSISTPTPMRTKPSIASGTIQVSADVSYSDVQSGFNFSVTNTADNSLTITATKTDHRLSDANLFLGSVLFDAEIY